MTEKAPDLPPEDSPPPVSPSGDAPAGTDTTGTGNEVGTNESGDEERKFLSYEGAVVPRFVALVWLIFIIFAAVYLMRYVPSSWMEWFSRE